jgi:hypothetical protein
MAATGDDLGKLCVVGAGERRDRACGRGGGEVGSCPRRRLARRPHRIGVSGASGCKADKLRVARLASSGFWMAHGRKGGDAWMGGRRCGVGSRPIR